MTIKRRLYISNVLMIALPMLLTVTTFIVASNIFLGLTQQGLTKGSKVLFATKDEAQAFIDQKNYTELRVDVAIYQAEEGGYLVVGPEGMRPFISASQINRQRAFFFACMILLLLAMVYITNRRLTHYVFKNVMTPIETLTKGVHKIRDGHLDYRIRYDRKDEFAPICEDFNEMACRLSDMVARQQKDEQNRRELIAGISHDLRTPLTSIKAYIEGLEKGVAANPQMQKKYLSTIRRKTSDLEYIINQLFLFSKLDLGEYPFRVELTDMGDELQVMAESFTEEYRARGLNVTLTGQTEGVRCMLDVVQFHNVVQNILDNSLKYKTKPIANSEISCTIEEDTLHIAIADDGPGVPEDALGKLFDVFYRRDASRSKPEIGNGLGLAISEKIIARHGGSIHAENVPSGGLCIHITLPIQEGGSSNEANSHH